MKNEVGGGREEEEENKLNLSTSIQSASWIKMSEPMKMLHFQIHQVNSQAIKRRSFF